MKYSTKDSRASDRPSSGTSLSKAICFPTIDDKQNKWLNLFEARCEDLDMPKSNQYQFERFMKNVDSQKKERLVMREVGFGAKSVPILASIIRHKK